MEEKGGAGKLPSIIGILIKDSHGSRTIQPLIYQNSLWATAIMPEDIRINSDREQGNQILCCWMVLLTAWTTQESDSVCVCVGWCGYLNDEGDASVTCPCVWLTWSQFILITTLTVKHDIEQRRILIYISVCCLRLALTVTGKGTGRSELSKGQGYAIPHFNTCGLYWTSLLNSCVQGR